MNSAPRFRKLCFAALCAGSLIGFAEDRKTAPPDYDRWIFPFQEHPIKSASPFPKGGHPPMSIVAVTGEYNKAEEWSGGSGTALEFHADGEVWEFRYGWSGTKGGGGDRVDLGKITTLIKSLPPDGRRLPPEGRRLVVQVSDGGGTKASVYDRANAPQALWEIARIAKSRIRPFMPTFEAAGKWQPRGFEVAGGLALSPDGKLLAHGGVNQSIVLWNTVTHQLLKTIDPAPRMPTSDFAFSPDGSLLVIQGRGECAAINTKDWTVAKHFAELMQDRVQPGVGFPLFTRDGMHLFLRGSDGRLRIYDRRTWEPVDALPEIPINVAAYFPAPKGPMVVVASGETIALYDSRQKKTVAELATGAHLARVAFSPDEKRVVVGTNERRKGDYWTKARARIWDTASGALLHELRVQEHDDMESVTQLQWTNDGQHVLGAFNPYLFGNRQSVCVWSARSGRHRGGFSGSDEIFGFAVTGDGSKLFVGHKDGTIAWWDFAAAMKKIAQFEAEVGEEERN